ncbi:MAG: hypothetical protein HY898_19585 [Deltaproteobacteria bacterium]|nr:hypothetical protein [Deltaproteobacteria bacterium]
MPRDSLYSERIVWSGEPATVGTPSMYRAGAWLLAIMSADATLLAIAAARAAHLAPARLIIFAAWCATFALAIRMIPVIWSQAARFVVTDQHVIWARGTFKRTMQRDAISYARIQWSRHNPGVGDLELVRAVPAGVLHRGLTLVLQGVTAPDRVWSIVRGVPTTAAGGDGRRPLSQRLDDGERVLWSGQPTRSWRAWLPLSTRRLLTTTLAVACFAAAVRSVSTGVPIGSRLLHAGVPVVSLTFLALVAAFALTVGVLAAIGGAFLYQGVVRKPLLDRSTRYLVTDRRVLIQRGHGEIHLDRSNVVDLMEEKGLYGGVDAYLIMDGPRSRGFAASGAFGPGERAKGFLPMLRGIHDVEGLRAALGQSAPLGRFRVSKPSAAGA